MSDFSGVGQESFLLSWNNLTFSITVSEEGGQERLVTGIQRGWTTSQDY